MFPKLLASLAIIVLLSAPLALFADGFPPDRLVPPCEDNYGDGTTEVCGFVTLMHLIRHLIDFALFLVMPIAATIFAYAGFLYLTAGANPGNVGKAKGMFWAAAIGLFWTLGAWLVIKLISDALLQPAYTVLPN